MSEQASDARWLEAWGGQADRSALSIYHDLVKRYSEPHRHYHNLKHLSQCLEELAEARCHADHPLEVELATWFHDAVYDPSRSDNEEASTSLAVNALGGLIEVEPLERVRRLILATKHTSPPLDADEGLVMDVDLAILGRNPEEFQEYEDGIRREYDWVPEERFKRGRAGVLKRFIARQSIYYTEHFRCKYEEKARANIRRSLSRQGAPDPQP